MPTPKRELSGHSLCSKVMLLLFGRIRTAFELTVGSIYYPQCIILGAKVIDSPHNTKYFLIFLWAHSLSYMINSCYFVIHQSSSPPRVLINSSYWVVSLFSHSFNTAENFLPFFPLHVPSGLNNTIFARFCFFPSYPK